MKRILEDIKNSTFSKTYLLYGEEAYLKRLYRDKLLQALGVAEDSMNFSRFVGKGLNENEIIDLGQTMPFFAQRRVILIEDSGFCKNATEKIADYIKDLPSYLILIFVESEVDKRNRVYKALSKSGPEIDFQRQNEKSLASWVGAMLAKQGKKIRTGDVDLFLTMSGSDMQNIYNEIQKLSDYTMGRDLVTAEDILSICTGQINNRIFDMIRAVTKRRQKEALRLYYDLLALKEPPMRILFLLARDFDRLYLLKDLQEKNYGQAQMAKQAGLAPFVLKNYLACLRDYSKKELKAAVEDFVFYEEEVKTGRLADRLSVELLIIKYSQNAKEQD